MLRRSLPHQPPCLCVSSLTSSRFPGFTDTCVWGNPIFAGGKSVRLRGVFRDGCGKRASLAFVPVPSVRRLAGRSGSSASPDHLEPSGSQCFADTPGCLSRPAPASKCRRIAGVSSIAPNRAGEQENHGQQERRGEGEAGDDIAMTDPRGAGVFRYVSHLW